MDTIVQTVDTDPWSCNNCKCGKQEVLCFLISTALAAIAGVGAYFALVKGLVLMDVASSSLSQFGAGFLVYSGLAFSVVAVGNIGYGASRIFLCRDSSGEIKYTPSDAAKQVTVSLLGPITAIPVIIIGGFMCIGGQS